MTAKLKYIALDILALVTCITPPAATVVYFFPIWKTKGGEAVLSGFCLFLLILCAVPLFKRIREFFKNPSSRTIWIIGLVTFWSLSAIAEEMKVICAVGLIANVAGGFVYKLRDRYKEDKK